MSIRLMLVDDRAVVRAGLCAFMATTDGVEIVGQACDGREAVDLARDLRPDVILMDLLMPEMDGVEATATILAEDPAAKILVLTSFGSETRLLEAIRAGASGCLLKDSGPEDLLAAVERVAHGGTVLEPAIPNRLASGLAPLPAASDEARGELLPLLAQGLSDAEIAGRLRISTGEAGSRVAALLADLGLGTRLEGMLYAIVAGTAPAPGDAALTAENERDHEL